ncbi:uncharacterized protein FOMMEDRAFT_166316 [Fomitiporia mediterranea MF3/22]|uniref:uncharacterized protein n=1 Tax=Fomitiporia mediterranea (strain MF3/22) TaxID=694068 RepID=UPI0004409B26|nr:uncharacterized protein FOMMEDRAFT_166316 [Fomitiporia mediterranea MF3/22]EJD06020.1 hypothetical protein FOMMEDRAFT_166316 [Fomitiporia mediterranea MF3/22]
MPTHRASQVRPRDHTAQSDLKTSLKPHHIPLLGVLFWVFHPQDRLRLEPSALLEVFRVLISEISEVTQPKSFCDLLAEIDKRLPIAKAQADGNLSEKLRALPPLLNSPHRLTEFFSELTLLWLSDDDESVEQDPPIEKRSLFGLFLRRAYLAFRKLSFLGLSSFVDEFQAWASGNTSQIKRAIAKDAIRNDDILIKTHNDIRPSADPESFAVFDKARANGDAHVAAENVRRFFEQRFNESTDLDLRQLAIFNLVRTHIFNGHLLAARNLLLEAITVARTSGDNIVLQQCMALLRRIEGRTRSRREPLNEIQADIPPMEVLNDCGKLLREAQPLGDCFEKVVEALAVYDNAGGFRGSPTTLDDQWAFHAMQSVLWKLAGCERLAMIEESIVLAFTASGGPDDNRFTILQNRAAMYTRQSKEVEAFSILLDPETWRGLSFSLNQVQYWSGEIWITMLHLATRRGQIRQADEFLKPRRPGSFNGSTDLYFLPLDRLNALPTIAGQLYRALQMRKVNQGASSVDHILKALWQSEYQGRFRLYRLAMILLADVGLEFGMTVWSRRLVEEVLPQLISGEDIEQRAFACFVLARCIIACAEKNPEELGNAIPYLQIAEQDYRTLEIHTAVQDVLYVTALVYNSLGEKEHAARDAAAMRHMDAKKEHMRLERIPVNEGWSEIWDLTCEICSALALRQ